MLRHVESEFDSQDNSLGITSWFVVLPDHDCARRVAEAIRPRASRVIGHPSGRPWLLGRWAGSTDADTGAADTGTDPVVGRAGAVAVAVIGQHAVTAAELTVAAGRIDTPADVDRLATSLAGSAHVVASVAGQVRVQGTLTGLRPVFHARIPDPAGGPGAVVAADRADVLAELVGTGLDERRFALHLLDSSALHPLAGEPVWRGVHAVPFGHYLLLDGERHRAVRWWTPPAPTLPIGEGAPALREALSAAVGARVRGRDLVSSDLGGLDSTSLCCLAVHAGAKAGTRVVAYTADGRDPMADDVAWARRTVAGLAGLEPSLEYTVEHHVVPGEQLPMVYGDLGELAVRFDEPCPAAVHLNRWYFIARLAATRGSRLHLTGFGGDELLASSPAHLHAMLPTHPRLALRRARGFAIQRPWGYRETMRQLLDRRPYRTWLASVPDQLTDPPPAPETPTLDWGMPPRLPPWATPDAVGSVREQVRAAARAVEPLAQTRGQHVELEAMRSTSRMVRQLSQLADGRLGLAIAAPYYDDRVIEAGLAVRPHDKITPWRYKPLIVEAMRGVVPDESLSRHTKDEGSHEVEAGLAEHRAELMALCEDSRLARLGLIDAGVLREVCSRPLPPTLPFNALYQTVACELWLRALERTTVPS